LGNKKKILSHSDDINTKPGDGPRDLTKAKPDEFVFKDPPRQRGQANRHHKPGGGATVILALARESKSTFIGCSSQQEKAPMLSWSRPPLWIE
jgi:hypothetical protein